MPSWIVDSTDNLTFDWASSLICHLHIIDFLTPCFNLLFDFFWHFSLPNIKNDQKWLFFAYWRTSKRATIIPYLSKWLKVKVKVNPSDQMEKNGQKWLISHIDGRQYAKKVCSQNFFDLKFSGNVKSGLKSLDSKFQGIWKILSWPKWSKTMILATLSLIPERQDFSRKNGPCHRSSVIMV